MQAARWRYRARLAQVRKPKRPLEKNMGKITAEMREFERYAAAVGADRYRVPCIKMDADGGKKPSFSTKKTSDKGIHPKQRPSYVGKAQAQRRGENFYYTPLSEEKHHFLIDDMTAESLECLRTRTACARHHSGKFAWKCPVLRPPSCAPAFDSDVCNQSRNANRLWRKKLFGCIHPHRAPA
jgi:hypothetical protein